MFAFSWCSRLHLESRVATPATMKKTRMRRADSELQILRADNLTAIPGLMHGFSTRLGGVSEAYGGGQLNLGFTASDVRASVGRNRRAFVRELTLEGLVAIKTTGAN